MKGEIIFLVEDTEKGGTSNRRGIFEILGLREAF